MITVCEQMAIGASRASTPSVCHASSSTLPTVSTAVQYAAVTTTRSKHELQPSQLTVS